MMVYPYQVFGSHDAGTAPSYGAGLSHDTGPSHDEEGEEQYDVSDDMF